MLLVIGNWIYIGITSFVIGVLALYPFTKWMNLEIKKPTSYIWAGLVVLTCYSQVFSLFTGVSLIANIIVIAATILGAVLCRKRILQVFSKAEFSKWMLVGVAVTAILLAYATSRGYMAYDTGLYHAQAIRWIEEYGVVPGLGLLHTRFAYNSSSFALSALYSFSFLLKEPLHAVAGFMSFLLGCSSLPLFKVIKRKKLLLSDFVRIGALYYLSIIFNEIVAPTSDFFSMITVFFIVLTWTELLENKENNTTPYALLCIVSSFAISLKLSAGLMVLLAMKPIIMLFKEKKRPRILLYLLIGLAVVVPFLVRGVIISGWLLYPATVLDFFPLPWKISASNAVQEAREIQAWGRGISNSLEYQATFGKWILPWFRSQSVLSKGMLLLDAIGLLLLCICSVWSICKRKREHLDWILLTSTVYASFLLWFFSAPLVRYGYAYVILPFLISFGYWLCRQPKSQYIIMICVALFLSYKLLMIGGYVWETMKQPYYIKQMAYEEFDLQSYEINGYTFYYPKAGDQVGYKYFPAMPYKFVGSFRGTKLEDGFVNSRESVNEND